MAYNGEELYEAIISKDPKKVEICVKKCRLDLNITLYAKGETKGTPLEVAIDADSLKIVKILINNGARLSRSSKYASAYTPLIHCIRNNKLQIAKYFVEIGANVCEVDKYNTTPLSWAVSEGNIEMIDFLLSNGAQWTLHTGVLTAIERRNCELLKLLIEKGAVLETKDGSDDTLLLKSVRMMNFPAVKYLVEKGADIQATNNNRCYDNSVLSTALSNSDFRTFDFLMQAGADLNSVDKEDIKYMAAKNPDFAAYIENMKNQRMHQVTGKGRVKEVVHQEPIKTANKPYKIKKFGGHEEAPIH